ncbi:hypothetical protein M422DRAFT_250329 [Sphaerobolus stellatus SS14]|uniref:Uncharacterized protein n=1 Tax=Sphaerobolus stellatus (strain SS14) TaxID=990650 RepID=A0A0C9W3C8_SPHS4|nr:hypothetical protein M422DRAFT_250329 [Sphaerobolus stellatus SS14]
METKWLSASIGYVVWGIFVEGYERESAPSRSPYEQARFQVLDEKKQVWQNVKFLHNTLSMKSKLDAPVGLEGWAGWLQIAEIDFALEDLATTDVFWDFSKIISSTAR